ncbi:hypothetical protein NQZ68_031160 [Dissostichus eleginoides]|nr:hypothetical protein NQZ68_031160 [Dissostichus eleginoides]
MADSRLVNETQLYLSHALLSSEEGLRLEEHLKRPCRHSRLRTNPSKFRLQFIDSGSVLRAVVHKPTAPGLDTQRENDSADALPK